MTKHTKIVFNECHGGFGLSALGMHRYAELKGLKLYPEGDRHLVTYWTLPPEERKAAGLLEGDAFYEASMKARQASNELYSKLSLSDRDIPRDDRDLVKVVEELGKEANGEFANLQIAKVPKGQRYRIDEYDGAETVMTIDDYEWHIA